MEIIIILFIVALGFVLPNRVGRKAAACKAEKYHEWELKTWGFQSEERDGPWINCIEGPVVVKGNFSNTCRFYSEWLAIENGYVIVNPGKSTPDLTNHTVSYDFGCRRTYSWDGCTPKLWFYWLVLIGTPDWHRKKMKVLRIDHDDKTKTTKAKCETVVWPLAHRASFVHDAFYQYLSEIPVCKAEVDKLFEEMLLEDGMHSVVARVYYLFVKYFGGLGACQQKINKDSPFTCSRFTDVLKEIAGLESKCR